MYKCSMHAFILQIAINIECSETTTHLLPDILSLMIAGVNAASSSAVMKFDPPPEATLLNATQRIVYHTIPFNMT